MNKYWSIVSLMAALAVSAASAAGTPAGTVIKNEATLTFSDDTGKNEKTITSLPVTTTVKAVPSFVLTKNDESPDVTKPDYTKPGQTNTAAKPGDTIVFPYVLTNTGNVPQESYDLGNQAPDAASGVKPGTDVRYYLTNPDTNNDGVVSPAELTAAGAGITSLSGLDPDKAINFFQIYTVPAGATSADKYGADPTGTRKPNALDKGAVITLPIDANNSNTASVVRNDGGVIGPKADPTAAGGAQPYQTGDTVPVTVTPDRDGKDTQTANATTTTTVITFTNTIKNNGNRPDTFTVTATPQDFPAGSKVELLNPDGTPFTKTPSTDPTKTTDILVRVTLPAGVSAPDPTKKPTVNLEVTSGNDPTKKDPTKDIVNLPGLKFGDLSPAGGIDPTPVTPATPAPGKADPTDPTAISVDPKICVTSSDAYLPMGVQNLGTQPDRFVVSGSAVITSNAGVAKTINVVYYTDTNANGKLDAGEPKLADVAGGQDVGTLAPGAVAKLVAVIAVPCDSAKGTYTVTQNVKSVDPTDPTKPGTGLAGTDTNDTVKVGGNGQTPTITKAVDLAEAKPGDILTYTIQGKNTTNSNVTKAIVKDVLPANTTYSVLSATSTSTGKVLYSNDGTVWTAAAPATATTVYVGVDTNADGNITVADILKPGETIDVTLKVKVN
ncbi:DUF11 domain-containing protein [Deinococcus sp.]|uniref:DUF11 domain-containing protein n=1 Tax=Deinococcus sp. TaxID=47478 RepID=UPI0025CBCE96|nr:DUF11 domain-containing protein [Deinococcus sp.]